MRDYISDVVIVVAGSLAVLLLAVLILAYGWSAVAA